MKRAKPIPREVMAAAATLLTPYYEGLDLTTLQRAVEAFDADDADPGDLMTVPDFAERLGVHPESVYRMIRQGRPSHREAVPSVEPSSTTMTSLRSSG